MNWSLGLLRPYFLFLNFIHLQKYPRNLSRQIICIYQELQIVIYQPLILRFSAEQVSRMDPEQSQKRPGVEKKKMAQNAAIQQAVLRKESGQQGSKKQAKEQKRSNKQKRERPKENQLEIQQFDESKMNVVLSPEKTQIQDVDRLKRISQRNVDKQSLKKTREQVLEMTNKDRLQKEEAYKNFLLYCLYNSFLNKRPSKSASQAEKRGFYNVWRFFKYLFQKILEIQLKKLFLYKFPQNELQVPFRHTLTCMRFQGLLKLLEKYNQGKVQSFDAAINPYINRIRSAKTVCLLPLSATASIAYNYEDLKRQIFEEIQIIKSSYFMAKIYQKFFRILANDESEFELETIIDHNRKTNFFLFDFSVTKLYGLTTHNAEYKTFINMKKVVNLIFSLEQNVNFNQDKFISSVKAFVFVVVSLELAALLLIVLGLASVKEKEGSTHQLYFKGHTFSEINQSVTKGAALFEIFLFGDVVRAVVDTDYEPISKLIRATKEDFEGCDFSFVHQFERRERKQEKQPVDDRRQQMQTRYFEEKLETEWQNEAPDLNKMFEQYSKSVEEQVAKVKESLRGTEYYSLIERCVEGKPMLMEVQQQQEKRVQESQENQVEMQEEQELKPRKAPKRKRKSIGDFGELVKIFKKMGKTTISEAQKQTYYLPVAQNQYESMNSFIFHR